MRQNATLCVFFMVVLSPTTKGPSITQNITTYSHGVVALFVHSLTALKRVSANFTGRIVSCRNHIDSCNADLLFEIDCFLGVRTLQSLMSNTVATVLTLP